MGTTRQYLAGELSVLLGHLQAVTTTEAAGRDAWSLRHAAETEPIPILRLVTVRALALTEGLCWDSLNWGDTAAFSRQAAVCAELHEFGVCAGLLKEAQAGLLSVLRIVIRPRPVRVTPMPTRKRSWRLASRWTCSPRPTPAHQAGRGHVHPGDRRG